MKKLAHFVLSIGLITANVSYAVSPPPILPTDFRPEDLKSLIARVGEERSVMIIKYGFFLAPERKTLPKQEALNTIKSFINLYPKGSKEWILLNDISAFGALRMRTNSQVYIEESIYTYSQIFAVDPRLVEKSNEVLILKCIRDYINGYLGRMQREPVLHTEESKNVLRSSLLAYINFSKNGNAGREVFVPFHKIIGSTSFDKTFKKEIMEVLAKSVDDSSRNYSLLALYATLYRADQKPSNPWINLAEKSLEGLPLLNIAKEDEKRWIKELRRTNNE